MIKVIIIDDEHHAIDLLQGYVDRIPFLTAIASFRNPLHAISFLQINPVDLIFLDINMPQLSGISFLKTVHERPHVILTTAYSEYAVESYEYEVTDYLLKPIAFERFLSAAMKVQKAIHTKASNLKREEPTEKVIIIKNGYEQIRVNMNEILYLKKEGNYITYHTTNKTVLSRQTIQQALEGLDSHFIQIHKSFIANLRKIDAIATNTVRIAAIKLPIGQSFKALLHKHFNNKN